VQTRSQPPPKQTQPCRTYHDRTRKCHKQNHLRCKRRGKQTASKGKEHFAHSDPTSPSRALRTVGVQGFAKQERTARRSQNEDREDCKEDHPGNDLQKGGKLAASRQTLPHTCRLCFTSEHCRKHKKGERLLEKRSLEAALITFLLKSTFFFDFLLFSQKPEAAKESSRQKTSFPRKPSP
jgi:hypothetical protein